MLISTVSGSTHRIPATLLITASAGLFAAAVMLSALKRRAARAQERIRADQRVDKGLHDTFPASDARAPHYVDIPVNRR